MNDIITTAEVHTRHPERYLLHNAADGTTWSLTEDGHWVRANQPTEPARVLPSERDLYTTLLAQWNDDDFKYVPSIVATAERSARAVLALFANSPTVEQVKAEALREAKEWIEEHSSNWTNYDLISGAQASVGMIEGLIDRLAPAQPVPDVPEAGLPTPEVPNVGGEDRG